MSFIYEALKRAEDENAKGLPAPRIIRRPALFVAWPRWWVWALAAVLGVNALVVGIVLLRGSHAPEVKVAAPAVAPPIVPPTRAPETVSETPRAPAVVATTPPPPAPVVAAPATPSPTPPVAAPTTKPAPRTARPAAPLATPPESRSATAVLTPARPAPQVAAPASPPTPAPASPPAPAAPSQASAPTQLAAPSQPTASPAAEAPKLRIQVVLYSEVAAERLVIIDGRRYAEGDKVDADTVVETITPQGAIVVRNGRSFTLTSGR